MSSFPNEAASDYFSIEAVLRKIAHLFEFGLLFAILFLLYRSYGVRKSKALFYALLLGFLYSISDEIHQSFVPTRTATYKDVVIDTTGMLIASWLILIFNSPQPLTQNKNNDSLDQSGGE